MENTPGSAGEECPQNRTAIERKEKKHSLYNIYQTIRYKDN